MLSYYELVKVIFDIDINKLDLTIDKGSVVIERRHGQHASLSYDDKFKPYVTVHKKDNSIKVQVSKKLSSFKTRNFI